MRRAIGPQGGVILISVLLLLGILAAVVIAQGRSAVMQRQMDTAFTAHRAALNVADAKTKTGETQLIARYQGGSFPVGGTGNGYILRKLPQSSLSLSIGGRPQFYTVTAYGSNGSGNSLAPACLRTLYEVNERCLTGLSLLGVTICLLPLTPVYDPPRRVHLEEILNASTESACLAN